MSRTRNRFRASRVGTPDDIWCSGFCRKWRARDKLWREFGEAALGCGMGGVDLYHSLKAVASLGGFLHNR
jgi:hypothetical protein